MIHRSIRLIVDDADWSRSPRIATLFLIVCLAVLFFPGIGDYRWLGLLGFLYIGLPWYIMAARDRVAAARLREDAGEIRRRPRSPTLLVFGLVAALVGVAIDLFVVYQFVTAPGTTTALGLVVRLLIGLPFFGFGVGLIYLSLGIRRAG